MSKKQPKLTPWFPADVRPAHVGFYQVDWSSEVGRKATQATQWFALWDGSRWSWMDVDQEGATRYYERGHYHLAGTLAWRGVAQKPKAVKS